MQKAKKTLPPLKVIESKPYRKSRSETLLRILMTTSYPHALLGNITLELAKGHGMSEEDDLNTTAKQLREFERDYTLFDFIRCIELKRTPDTLTVQAKRLRDIEQLTGIIDGAKTHETVTETAINCGDTVLTEEGATQVAKLILNAFYRSQVSGHDRQREAAGLLWAIRERKLADDLYSAGEVKKNLSLSDLNIQTVESVRDQAETVTLLTRALMRTDYNIILAQNRLLIKNQSIRISLHTPKQPR